DRRELHRGLAVPIMIGLKGVRGFVPFSLPDFGSRAPSLRYSRIAAAEFQILQRNSDALRRKISERERSFDFARNNGSRFRGRFGFEFGCAWRDSPRSKNK